MQLVMMLFYFNPRGRKDLDILPDIPCHLFATFQSTRSQRPRRKDKNSAKAQGHFNPRGRKDLDTVPHHGRKAEGYFNPRGRKDLDTFTRGSDSAYRVFQSTRSQRPRLDGKYYIDKAITFQSTRSQRPRQFITAHEGAF